MANIIKSDDQQNYFLVIDLASPHGDMVKAARKACEWGFFHVINHGISRHFLKKVLAQSEEFLSLPLEEKAGCTKPAKVAGPIHFGGDSNGDWRDVLKIHCEPQSEVAKELWPVRPIGFKETIIEHVILQEALVRRLLKIISESLGLDRDYIEKACQDPRVLMAINHYPPCPDPTPTMGIREHSDPNTISILLDNQVAGLQVYKNGWWLDVKSDENALVVNVGDHLQILSNGRYSSCLHRVVNSKTSSQTSVALFFSPSMAAHIRPAPALVDGYHPAQYSDFMYSEFLKNFYANGGPNRKVILGKFQRLPPGSIL